MFIHGSVIQHLDIKIFYLTFGLRTVTVNLIFEYQFLTN
jgi:hypothetical protein